MEAASTAVLVVGDEPQICSSIGATLSRCGFDCRVCTDPQQAKQLLDERQFDLLISDIAMSQVSGLDLLVHIKHNAPNCKVIFTTDVSNKEHLAQALVLGAFDYVEKPFRTEELVEVVTRATCEDYEIPQLPLKAAAALQSNWRARQASLESVRALILAIEAKDQYTRRHSEQVTHYAVNLAELMELSPEQIESIRVASLLHDIGKIGVPDSILTNPWTLTDEEFEYIRRHPAIGADILANITMFGEEAKLIRAHHERWDGGGYPDGLTGEEAPLGARIIMIADSMDAMLMHRSYKKSYPVDKMLDELVRCAGTQFDPRLAATAVRWCEMCPEELILPGQPLRVLAATLSPAPDSGADPPVPMSQNPSGLSAKTP
ncbi:MAG: response regulator [Phycisphaerae bacterium]|nr:response regulator [Phycisphaerae bacterium]